MKRFEPKEGLVIYFDDNDKGVFTTPNVYNYKTISTRLIEKKQMTREEAVAKIQIMTRANGALRLRDTILNDIGILEILGLIKFKEEGKQYDTRTIIFSSTAPCAYQAISQLEILGYEIIKKS